MSECDLSAVKAAAQILREGGLVAFPTETVYGLGADATNPAAVERIYRAKGRPPTNPLIVHVSDEAMARRYTSDWPQVARILAGAFWPGPLTLVVTRAPSIAPQVGAGLETVGIRVPRHPLAQSLLREFDGPIAAPSANRSNRISPTSAEHVRAELGDAVNLILDGGPCQVGIESTVVDVSGPGVKLLRPGGITREQIAELVGELAEAELALPSQAAMSPGRQPIHYAPRTPAFRFDGEEIDRVTQRLTCEKGLRIAVLFVAGPAAAEKICNSTGEEESHIPSAHRIVMMPGDPASYARVLYAALHEVDDGGFEEIWIQLPPDESAWEAIRDRICRATKSYSSE